ncbi:MAG: preprotein translocase subunit SecG [Chlamydiae bacterium]|nr:preprotein translocase subunit SecG [Chlamydiota bacterium]
MSFLFYLTIFMFLGLCGLVCLLVLIQESKSLGLGASFGGDPGDSLFGTSTADVLKKFTAWMAAAFIVSCVLLSIWSESLATQAMPVPYSIEELDQGSAS